MTSYIFVNQKMKSDPFSEKLFCFFDFDKVDKEKELSIPKILLTY